MLVIFRIAFMAFMAVVGLSRVSNIDCVNDVALFIKSKAAVDTHAFLLELLSGTHENPAAETTAICESFGYEAFLIQRGEKIAALPAITGLGKNTSWGTDIESRNVLFVPR
jgi:hypothetical protein